jgi:murein DD-endopeptidase MepM/ murein hydrolase activator NlpD
MRISPLIVAGLLGLFASPASAARWRWPVRGPVVERFRVGPDRFAPGQHRGIDIAAAVGTAVRSACAGRVTFAGAVGAGGRTVSVRCGALIATYQHLAGIAAHRGDELGVGSPLGAVGRSGRPRSPSAHLHFGVHRTLDRHAYLDPLALLGEDRRRPPAAPLLPIAPRPAGRAPLGPAPGVAAARTSPLPLPRPARRALPRPEAGRVGAAGRPASTVVWVGIGLALLALPGLGLRARRRRRRPARASPPRFRPAARRRVAG